MYIRDFLLHASGLVKGFVFEACRHLLHFLFGPENYRYTTFSGIRLYRDTIVKIWNFIGRREVKLADARLRCNAGKVFRFGRYKEGPFNKYMTIFDRRVPAALSSIMGVSYDEKLADPGDVRKLNQLLAGLTGRKVEEFEQPRIRMERLIQEGGR
jgi:hypothetical protein